MLNCRKVSNLKNLQSETERFFSLFWKENKLGKPPEWSSVWLFTGSLEDREKKGCYALLENETVVYVGLGIGNGKRGLYEGNGIGHRVNNYWNRVQGEIYKPSTEAKKKGDITGIITIGFSSSEEYFCLAAALEVFLIRALKPRANRIHGMKLLSE